MALNLKNPEVERLASEVARIAGETKTEAIRRALLERQARLQVMGRRGVADTRILQFLEQNVWPTIPSELLGRQITREEEDRIPGYGTGGV